MAQEEAIKLFEGLKIRIVWDDEKEKYYFSVVDIIQVLTESTTPRRYWSDLKRKLEAEGSEVYEKIVQLKMTAPDGKQRLTDVADTEQVLRLIQSVPSKKAEPFKQWLAQVGAERIRQMQDPERSIEQAVQDYRRLGYSENWINQRIKTIEIRKGLTDERNLISQRTKEALARLKAEGKHVGRPQGRKTRKELLPVYRHEAYVCKALQNGLSQRKIAERIHCSRNTLRRYIAQYLNP